MNPSQYPRYYEMSELALTILGKAVFVVGVLFKVEELLLSYILRHKQGMQIAKYLDSLKDKEKVRDYEVYIKDQKRLIEKRLEFIRNQGNVSAEVESIGDEREIEDVEIREIKAEGRRLRKEDKGKTSNLRKKVVNEKKVLDVEVKREYKVNLSGKACRTTWSQLFDITKSKPDNLVVQGSHVKTLIEALGGRVVLGNLNQIYFSGKYLGSYEVAHGGDRNGYLRSKFANRVKKAIEEAIESGYISESIVKVV
jgi:hypothetical protein